MEEVENGPTYIDEQRQLYRDRLDDLNIEKQARLEILSQNQKDLQPQVARIKQTIVRVLDQNTSLLKIIRTLALSITILTIVLAIADVFREGGGGAGGSPPRDERVLKKWLDRLANALKRLAGKAIEALLAIVGSVVGAILNSLSKAKKPYNLGNNSIMQRQPNRTVYFGTERITSLAPKLWELIPSKIKSAKLLNIFKAKLKSSTTDKCPCRLCWKHCIHLAVF